jgi:hypothetical protein
MKTMQESGTSLLLIIAVLAPGFICLPKVRAEVQFAFSMLVAIRADPWLRREGLLGDESD